jgi:ribosomal subunit interface protein
VRVTITARHVEITDELRARARELVERLERVAPRATGARVTFAEDHGEAEVELQISATRGQLLVARGAGPDHRTALDRAADRLRRRAGRHPDKRRALHRESR